MSELKKIGRPIIGQKKDIQLKILIDKETSEKIDYLCFNRKVSKSELIRSLVRKEK